MQRMLLQFALRGDLKYLSHLEMSRAMARTMRRAGLPIAFSQGFNPHPRLSFWHALPVGVEAQEDIVEVWLREPVPPAEVLARLNEVMPAGMEIFEAREVGEDEPKLTRRFTHALYVITVADAARPEGTGGVAETLSKGFAPEDGEIINAAVGEGRTEIWLLACHREEGPRLRKLAIKAAECLGTAPQSATVVRKGVYPSREAALAGNPGLNKI